MIEWIDELGGPVARSVGSSLVIASLSDGPIMIPIPNSLLWNWYV